MQRVSGQTDDLQLLPKIGEAIRSVRRESGVSQEALADAAGLDRSHVGRIERGERNLTLLNLARIATALNLQAWELLEKANV